MSEAANLTASLKRLLRSRSITYAQLAREIGLSEASVKRVFSRRSFTLSRLEQILRVLDVELYELARMAKREAGAPRELSLEQEAALADDPVLLAVFSLLVSGWKVTEIRREYAITAPQSVRLLARLDRLGLVKLGPSDRVKLLTARGPLWRRGGPVRRRYESLAMKEFFASEFGERTETLRFDVKELSTPSLAVMQRKLARLAEEFDDLASIDATLPPADRHSVGLVAGIRPWVFSLVSELKRRPVSRP